MARDGGRVIVRGISVLVAVATLAACHSSDRRVLPEHVERVVSISRERYAGAPRYRLAPVSGICAAPRSAECPVDGVRVAAFGRAGTILLADSDGVLRQFDERTGALRGTIHDVSDTSRGYISAAAVRTDERGTVWIFDDVRLRLIAFDSSGRLAARLQLSPRSEFQAGKVWPGGVALFSLPAALHVGDVVDARFDLIRADGTERHSPLRVRLEGIRARSADLEPMRPFFLARPVWDVSRDRSVWVTTGSAPWIAEYAESGTARLLVYIPVVAHPVTREELEREEQRVLRAFSPGWRRRTLPFVQRAATEAPRVHPLITAIVSLADGGVSVRESPRAMDDSARWDIIDRRGALTGWIRLAGHDRVADGTRSRILVIRAGAQPDTLVTEYRLVAAPE